MLSSSLVMLFPTALNIASCLSKCCAHVLTASMGIGRLSGGSWRGSLRDVTLVTPEKADVGVSGLDGELVLDSSGDLDRVEVESEVELEVSVPVGVVGAVEGLGSMWEIRWPFLRRSGVAEGSGLGSGGCAASSENGVTTSITSGTGVAFCILGALGTGLTIVPLWVTCHVERRAACRCVRTNAGSAGRHLWISPVLMLTNWLCPGLAIQALPLKAGLICMRSYSVP